jgi:hypothetical protein
MSHLQSTISTQDLHQLIEHQLQLAENNDTGASHLPPLMVWGPPGVGKSSIIRNLCSQHDIDFIDIRLSQREPVDLRGLPVPNGDHVDWLLASEWPRDPDSRGIILFDEITAADRALQVAAYEIILDRRLGDLYQLPKGWLVMAAGNRNTDQAVAYSFSSALANRFCHLELEADVDSWTRWALQQDLVPEVIAFVRYQSDAFFNMEGDLERGWPSPRSWQRVSDVLQNKADLPEHLLHAMIHGLIGDGAAIEFIAFLRQQASLPPIEPMLTGQAPITIPEEPDLRFAFSSALVHNLWRHQPKQISEHRLERFFEIMLAMSSDFATMTLLDALTNEKQQVADMRAEQVLAHPRFDAWSEQHGLSLQAHGGLFANA